MAPGHLLFRQQRPNLHFVYKSKPLVLLGQETASQKSKSCFHKIICRRQFSLREKIEICYNSGGAERPNPKQEVKLIAGNQNT